eukprot:scaffold4624_cov138-Isochrysis_galbana.AAC.7
MALAMLVPDRGGARVRTCIRPRHRLAADGRFFSGAQCAGPGGGLPSASDGISRTSVMTSVGSPLFSIHGEQALLSRRHQDRIY